MKGADRSIRTVLLRVLSRAVFQRIARTVLIALAALLIGSTISDVVRWRFGVDFAPWASVAALILVLGGAAFEWRARPVGRRWAARLVEQRLGWHEQLSAALESHPDENAVSAALHRHVETLARNVDVRRVLPWRWPNSLLIVLGATALTAGLAAQLPSGAGKEARVQDPSTDASMASGPNAPATDSLRRLADAVEADAERRYDPYLAGVAEALRDLSDRIEQGTTTERDQREALAEVMEHLARAYDSEMTGAELADRLLAEPSTDRAGDGSDLDPEEDLQLGAAGIPQAENPDDELGRLVEAATEPAREASSDEGTSGAPPSDVSANVPGYASRENAEQALEQQRQRANEGPVGDGERVGASEDASAGASQMAGRGSQELEGETTAPSEQAGFDEALAIRGEEREEGRRIEVEVPATAGWDAYDAARFTVGPWRTTDEAPLRTEVLTVAYRPIAGRYYMPSQETISHMGPNGP